MLTTRTKSKNYLKNTSLTDFWDVVREAKISPEDQQILEMRFVKKKSIVEIASKTDLTIEKVNRIIAAAYDDISRLLGF